MPNIGLLLKDEVSRLCRKEIRRQVGAIKKASTGYRREIAELKRQVATLTRQSVAQSRKVAREAVAEPVVAAVRSGRFSAEGLRTQRKRLGLTVVELAQLVGVTGQSIYNWEHSRAVPRNQPLARLLALRSVGKREAQARLAEAAGADAAVEAVAKQPKVRRKAVAKAVTKARTKSAARAKK